MNRRPRLMQKAGRFLSREEERTLLNRWCDHGDMAARDRLIAAHMQLAQKFAKKYARQVDVEDLLQEAVIGLIVAADRFRPDAKTRFATYAQYWVHATVREHVFKHSQTVRPRGGADGEKRFFAGERLIRIGLDTPMGEGGETIVNSFPSPDPSPEEVAGVACARSVVRAKLLEITSGNERSRVIAAERFLENTSTLDDLATRFGITKERVRQIEIGIVRKMHSAFCVERAV